MSQISAKEFAQKVESDARTVRKFLRDVTPRDEQPGKGSRWAIENRQVRSLTKKFQKWDEERKAAEEANEDETPSDA